MAGKCGVRALLQSRTRLRKIFFSVQQSVLTCCEQKVFISGLKGSAEQTGELFSDQLWTSSDESDSFFFIQQPCRDGDLAGSCLILLLYHTVMRLNEKESLEILQTTGLWVLLNEPFGASFLVKALSKQTPVQQVRKEKVCFCSEISVLNCYFSAAKEPHLKHKAAEISLLQTHYIHHSWYLLTF